MKQSYARQIRGSLLAAGLLAGLLSAHAQTAPAPVQQWQRVLDESSLTSSSRIQAVKSPRGGYGILTEKTLFLLALTGELIGSKPIPGAYADSSTNRVPIQKALAIAPTQDDGFAVLGVDVANQYYVTRLDSAGATTWTKTIARVDARPSVQVTQNVLTATPDGGFLVVGSYTDALSYLTLTKLNASGLITGEWRIKFSGPSPLVMPLIRRVLYLPGQGYLLIGRAAGSATTDSKGLAMQVDANYKVVWQQTYANLASLLDAVANPVTDGLFTAIGTGMNTTGQAITLAPNKPGDGTLLASLPGSVSLVSLATDVTGNVTVLDRATSNNGDFRLSNGHLPASFRWTKTFGGSGIDAPTDLLATDDGGYLVVGTTTSTDGDIKGKSSSAVAAWVLKVGSSPQVTTLRILPPTYDCQTGSIRFQSSGGDGSPIMYSTPGITRTSPTDTFGTVEPALRSNPTVVVLQATQSNQTVSYAFDLRVYCPPNPAAAPSDSLTLLAPTYNCQTGAITFHTRGGNGTPIEYASPGITDWTTNPDQVVNQTVRTAIDVPPIVLMARQQGRVVTYIFNLKAACGRARLGTADDTHELTVTLLGNPAQERVLVQIVGAGEGPVGLRLFDTRGQLVEQRTLDRADYLERQTFDLRQQASGTFLLHTTANGQTRIVKVVKQ